MDWFYSQNPPINNTITLSKEESRHLLTVRRAKIGDTVYGFNGAGTIYTAQIIADDLGATLNIIKEETPKTPYKNSITLGIAILKGDAMTSAIDAACVLGADIITPLICSRCIGKTSKKTLARYERTIIESAKQCNRPFLPKLSAPTKIENWVKNISDIPLKYVAHLDENTLPLKSATGDTAIAIGPEGGFSDKEIPTFKSANFTAISLAPYILRAKTAVATSISILRSVK